jgi:hypothetical protein
MPKNHPDYQVMTLVEFKALVTNSRFSRTVRTIINEHSAPFTYAHFDPKFKKQLLLDMDMRDRQFGYSSICYHVVVFPDGDIGYCRPIDDIPGGFVKDNSRDIIVCAIGDFNDDGDVMTADQQKAVVDVNAILCRKFSLKPSAQTITLACWYNLVTGELDGGGDPMHHKSSPGKFFFLGSSIDEAELEFIRLVKVRYKINKMEKEQVVTFNGLFKAIVTSDSLRIRNLPSADGETIGKLERGTTVVVYEDDDRWFRIDEFEHLWISARFADVVEE